MFRQTIVKAEPPMMAEIDTAFRVKNKPVIFSWGDKVYDPMGVGLSPKLVAHEAVHGERQLQMGVEVWWGRYIADPLFRLAEEIPAHVAEFEFCAQQPDADKPVPGYRSRLGMQETHIAQRLSGPLYGNLINTAEARRALHGVIPNILRRHKESSVPPEARVFVAFDTGGPK